MWHPCPYWGEIYLLLFLSNIFRSVRLLKQKTEMLENSFLKIANEAPVMLWIANQDKKFIFFNKSWLSYRGKSLADETKRNWMDSVHENDVQKVSNQFNKNFDTKKSYKVEYRLKRHDGSFRWVMENGTPRYDEMGKFIGYIGSCVDIHEIKELESRKEAFITAASHELRTPVTSLNVYLHLIDEYFKKLKVEKYSNYSAGAIHQLNKITNLIEQLLDLNKIQSGSLSYNFEDISLGAIVEKLIEKMRMLHPERNFIFIGKSTGQVYGDAERLSQAIENLLNNSLKFSRNNSDIIIEISEDNKNICLEITDFGIGIAKEYLLRIFERFFRIPGSKEATYPGMGMGLYLTKKIIDKHNGKITVESIENDYTKFSIKIPLL